MFPLRLEEFKKEAVMGEDFAEARAQFENRQNPVAWKTWKAGRIKKLQEKYIEARTLFLACFSMF